MDYDDKTIDTHRAAPRELITDFPSGHLIAGKYKVLSLLGKGGMGTVYRVQQIFLQKEFALKTMDRHAISETSLRRFQLEATSASKLNHLNLVQVHDFGLLDDTHPYLVMDFVNGITFAEYLKQHGPLPLAHIAPIFSQACFGLLAAHEQGIVHRDIKPGNIMLVDGPSSVSECAVKVVDFGIAKLITRESGEIQALTRTGEIFGSPLYMSPEQCCGGKVDHRSDIYSLGCVLFEMLTGTPPHMGATALATMMLHDSGNIPTLKQASLGNEYPPHLEQIVAKMLRRNPDERYQNIGLVAHALAAALPVEKSAFVQDVPKSSVAKQSKKISLSIFELSVSAIGLALLAGICGGLFAYHYATKVPDVTNVVAPKALQSVAKSDALAAVDLQVLNSAAQRPLIDKRSDAVNKLLNSATTLHSSIFTDSDGTKKRRLIFPSFEIGVIEGVEYDIPQVPAKGTVILPADKSLRLLMKGRKPEDEAAQDPAIFRQIGPADFSSLALSNPASNSQFGDVVTPKMRAKKLADIISIASSWSDLRQIELSGFPRCDAAFEKFNVFKKLNYLAVNKCGFESIENISQPFLSKLTTLIVEDENLEITDKIVQSLGSNSSIAILIVTKNLSCKSIETLRSCPHLITLVLDCPAITPASIEALSQLKSLKNLAVKGGKVSESLVTNLGKCRNAQRLIFPRKLYSPGEQKYLQSLDRRIEFDND